MPSSSGSAEVKVVSNPSAPNHSEEGNGTGFPKYTEYMNNKPFSPNASGLTHGSAVTGKFAFDSESRSRESSMVVVYLLKLRSPNS
jgi:hypothetical protein